MCNLISVLPAIASDPKEFGIYRGVNRISKALHKFKKYAIANCVSTPGLSIEYDFQKHVWLGMQADHLWLNAKRKEHCVVLTIPDWICQQKWYSAKIGSKRAEQGNQWIPVESRYDVTYLIRFFQALSNLVWYLKKRIVFHVLANFYV